MSTWSNYVIPGSIPEALQALASAPGPARPVAGGTDLLLELQQGRHTPVHTLVDLSIIPELNLLEIRGDQLFIGAAVPVSRITRSSLVHEHAMAVVEACDLIGGPQIRNTATLGGNVAHALPAADGMIALCALDARAEIASPQGSRQEPILSLFSGPGVSALKADCEILTGFYLQTRLPGQASAFGRVMRPQGVALPIINLAAWVERLEDRVNRIRLAIGPSGPTPRRAAEVEAALTGARIDEQSLAHARQVMRSSLRFRSSPQRGGAAYRYDLCEVLLEQVIRTAWQRAGEGLAS